jgi:gamma-glutamyl hercynylcysteine S-oxide synthase
MWIPVCLCLSFGFPAVSSRNFRVSAVQDSQVWIEGGLLDGLESGLEGEICYEISIAGQKRRIVPAKVRLARVEDRESLGTLYEQSGTINIGYSASFVPKTAGDLLMLFNKRASESFSSRDFKLAQQYYQRILEVLPGDAFALQKIRECDAQIEKMTALMRERRTVPYYKEVIRASLDGNDAETLKLAQGYVEKILAVEPGDPEAQKFKEDLNQRLRKLLQPEKPQVLAQTAPPESSPAPGPFPTGTSGLAEVKKPAVSKPIEPENTGVPPKSTGPFEPRLTQTSGTPALAQTAPPEASPAPAPFPTGTSGLTEVKKPAAPNSTDPERKVSPTEKMPVPAKTALAKPSPVPAQTAAQARVPEESKRAGAPKLPVPAAAGSTLNPAGNPDILHNMVKIPEGEYFIGSPLGRSPFQNETPRHQVHLEAFYIDKYEVTNEEYKKFCDATNRSYPGYFVERSFPSGTGKKPVVMISWIDADAYARWAAKRLPSEKEWEAAAGGALGQTWPWGNSWIPNQANTRESGEEEAAEVGTHTFDISEFGAYDLAGNVSEWTQDWYQPYPGNTKKEKEYGEQFKVLRGGSAKASKEFARAQFRARLPDGFRSLDLGFRCVVSAKDVKK